MKMDEEEKELWKKYDKLNEKYAQSLEKIQQLEDENR